MAAFLQFDRIDRKLLAELDRDSRQPLAQIAKKIRLGSDLVSYRVERYRREGLIAYFSAVVDPLAAGWWVLKVYSKIETSSKKFTALLRDLERHRATYWLAELHGRFDLLYSFCAADPAACRDFQDEIQQHYGDIILEQDVCIVTSVVRLSKKYLSQSAGREYVFEKCNKTAVLAVEDCKLLRLLLENAQVSAVELAEKVGLSPATVRSRLEHLQTTGIILGYRFQFDYSAVGLLLFKVLLQLDDYSTAFRDKLRNYCREHPQVTCYILQLGRFPIEIEVEVESYSKLNEFVEEFRRKFDRGIHSSEVLLVKRDHFHRFPEILPGG